MSDSSNVTFDCAQVIQLLLMEFFFLIPMYDYNYIYNLELMDENVLYVTT